MCGRYASGRTTAELAEAFAAVPDEAAGSWEPDHNVAPTDLVPAVLVRRPGHGGAGQGGAGQGGAGQGEAARRLTLVRWGLVPSWARDRRGAARLINARLETVAEKPSFRRAFAVRRCLLPADGWFEWTAPESGGRKQPWLLRPRDGGVLALAGIAEVWRDPAHPDAPPLRTAAVITTAAVDEAGAVHDRMPVLVQPEDWQAWLDPDTADPARLRALLRPAAAARIEVVPVSTAVNDVRSSGPELVRPVRPAPVRPPAPLDEAPTLF